MNKNYKIFFPKENPSLVEKLGHHFYIGKPFFESFFLFFREKLSQEYIKNIIYSLYDIKNKIEFLEQENNLIGYIKAFPIVYGYFEGNLSFLYFTGSNREVGFEFKGIEFSKEEIGKLIECCLK